MADIILKEESYKIVGLCMEIQRELGMGLKKVIYKKHWNMDFVYTTFLFGERKNMRWPT